VLGPDGGPPAVTGTDLRPGPNSSRPELIPARSHPGQARSLLAYFAVIENPAPGEVIWRDEIGVTCRRWNWRQCIRTRLDALTGRMWFVMEALETMPTEALHDAGNLLIEGLRQLIPGCEVSAHVVCAVDRS